MKFSKNSGFTMLELLAVLAIILILGAILFPAIESAREKSLTTACSQNVKQLTLAVLQYEGDKGRFPAGYLYTTADAAGTATDATRWYHAIRAYAGAGEQAASAVSVPQALPPTAVLHGPLLNALGNGDQRGDGGAPAPGGTNSIYPGIYRCPSAGNWDFASLNMSYGYNYQYLGNAAPLTVITGGAVLPSGNPVTGFANYPVSKASIRRAEKTICVADSDGTGWNAYQSAGDALAAGPDITRQGAYGYLLDPTFLPVRNYTQIAGGVAADPYGATPELFIAPPAAGLIVDDTGTIVFQTGGIGAANFQQQYRSIASRRHKGQCNVGFLDGHIETKAREELYFSATTSPGIGGIANANTTFPSNELWNGFGVDNDANGNGVIEPASGERINEENEAYTVANLLAAGPPPALSITAGVAANYDPIAAGGGTGYGRITGLQGPYVDWGPGFDVPNTAAFLTGSTGPTLPHLSPFDFSFQAAAVQ